MYEKMDEPLRVDVGRAGAPADVECAIDGIYLHAMTEAEVVSHVQRAALAGHGGVISTINSDHLRLNHVNPDFGLAVHASEVRVCDGMPVVWLSRLTSQPLPERVTGADLVWSLSAMAAEASLSLMLIGAADGVAARAAERFVEASPGLSVAGCVSPPMGFDRSALETESVLAAIRLAKPDLVFVALGAPRQELFIHSIRHEFPGTWWIGVGGGLDFATGHVQRAPELMQRTGLEWAFRVATDPVRLTKRYLIDDAPYMARVLLRMIRVRSRPSGLARITRIHGRSK